MDLQKVKAAFTHKGYAVRVFETAAEAADYLDGAIHGKTVGFGDSQTLKEMNLYARLSVHNQVVSPMDLPEGETFYSEAEKCTHTQVYLVSVNGAAETGELVNIDGFGNQVAGSLYCHEKVYFVIGRNKLAPTLDEAVWRARNIAAPLNAQRMGRKTPCAVKGDRCYDCKSPERICKALLVLWGNCIGADTEVLLVDEDLGL